MASRLSAASLLVAWCLASSLLSSGARAFCQEPAAGLIARYESDSPEVVERIVPRPDFVLSAGESIDAAVPPRFVARWKGHLRILEAAAYRFEFDGGSLEIDGRKVGEEPIELSAGSHRIDLLVERRDGRARSFRFLWSSEHFPLEPVPAAALSHEPSARSLDASASIRRGLALLERSGCLHCHPSESSNLRARAAPRLSRAGQRLRPAWLSHWLRGPAAVRRGAKMPALLEDRQVADVIAFLIDRGDRDRSADESLPPSNKSSRGSDAHDRTRGQELFDTIGCAACHGDDDLDLTGLGSKTTPPEIARYLLDPASVDRTGEMPAMALTREEARQLAAYLAESRERPLEQGADLAASGDAGRGREWIETTGCLSCHEFPGADLENRLTSRPLVRLDPRSRSGCLSDAPRQGVPRYALSRNSREDLVAAIDSLRSRPTRFPAPVDESRRRIERLRCSRCHEHEGAGPAADLAERVPSLDGVGSKLRRPWIARVLLDGARVRESLRLRMPSFAREQVEPLVAGLTRLDGLSGDEVDDREGASEEERAAGVRMLGTDAEHGGLSCISCHDVGDWRPVADEKGPQLLELTGRLRHDWFRRWMANPGRVVSGTSMPAYFLGSPPAEVDSAVRRLWGALELGSRMPAIRGVGEPFRVLGTDHRPVPGHEAIVQRLFLPDATPAAIAVGLPAQPKRPGVSLCFDASTCHVVYAWFGGFLDLRPTLGKRAEYPEILGEIFERRRAFPLRLGPADSADEPRVRFRGYRMREGSPEFSYRVDGVLVREHIVPLRQGIGYEQRFFIERVPAQSVYRAVRNEDETETPRVTSTIGQVSGGTIPIPTGEDIRFDVRVRAAPR